MKRNTQRAIFSNYPLVGKGVIDDFRQRNEVYKTANIDYFEMHYFFSKVIELF